MLYVTTRDADNAYTSYRALVNDKGPDGGYFAPFHLPTFDSAALSQLGEKTFNQIVAETLNLFFGLGLNGYDLDLSIGRNFVRNTTMNRKIVVAELWHNLGGSLEYAENSICKKIENEAKTQISLEWASVAIKIAVILGIYGKMLHEGICATDTPIDFSVSGDSITTAVALWYCREMGMPINMIICTTNNNGALWDFINRGTLQTAGIDASFCDSIERLLHAVFGCNTTKGFLDTVASKRIFTLDDEALQKLSKVFFCSVTGTDRAKSVINSVYRTNEYIINIKTALCYGGLQDYRAKSGVSGLTVVLSENNPNDSAELISDATGLSTEKIKELVK